MPARMTTVLLALALSFALASCASDDAPAPGEQGQDDPSAGSRLANGLYDLEDGRVQAVGTLERFELEGGFWAVTQAPAESDEGAGVIAVIANGGELEEELRPLEGATVVVTGERFEGASIRMAGPEVIAETVEEIDDAGGPAE